MSDWTDDQILAMLRRALEAADPVPETARRAARAAFTWRSIDAELAELVYDSAEEDVAGVRGTETARQVAFRAPGVEVEVMVTHSGGRRIVGQLVPPQSARIELQTPDGNQITGTDTLGRFSFDDVPSGPARLVVRGDDVVVVTEIVVI